MHHSQGLNLPRANRQTPSNFTTSSKAHSSTKLYKEHFQFLDIYTLESFREPSQTKATKSPATALVQADDVPVWHTNASKARIVTHFQDKSKQSQPSPK